MKVGETYTYRKYLVEFVSALEPRCFGPDDIIQEQFEEVFEVFFAYKGSVIVGYTLFNDRYLATLLQEEIIINDFATIHNKVSEFFYKPKHHVVAFGMRKNTFYELIAEERIGKLYLPQIDENY